jgi:hypothetical protein
MNPCAANMKKLTLVSAMLLGLASAGWAQEYVELLDTTRIGGHVEAIDEGKLKVRTDAGVKTLDVDEVAGVHYEDTVDLLKARGRTIVTTRSGMVLVANDLKAPPGKTSISFNNPLLGKQTLELGQIAEVMFSRGDLSPKQTRARLAEYSLASEGYDLLVVETETGRWVGVEGVFKGIRDGKVVWRYQQEDRTVDLKKVPVILIAKPDDIPEKPIRGMLYGLAGSRLAFSSISLDDGAYTLEAPALGTRQIRASQVARIRMRSDKVVDLTELSPEKVEEVGLFRTYRHRVDASVSGKPIRLDQRSFDVGLGLHSKCHITWDIQGKYKKFIAIVGINDSVRPKGDARVTFVGDGKPLTEPMDLTGRDEAATVSIDVTGVKKLTIRVDYGRDGLDAADHVDIAVPRLIK